MTLVDTATAAVALGVTERTVRRRVADGTLANYGTARRALLDLSQAETATRRDAHTRWLARQLDNCPLLSG